MKPLTIGLLGASGIAQRSVIDPAHRRDDVRVTAVAGRKDPSAYAAEHKIPTAYTGYDALLSDDSIDLVYVALPPSEHARWTIAALEAGKDVLCEKPITMNAAEAIAVRDAAERTGHRVIEAFHDYYHPLQGWLREFVESGQLGTITEVTAEFNATNTFDPASLRHDPALGGGALMDLGCYPVHWVRSLFGEPTSTVATAELNPLGADRSTEATLTFAGGITCHLRTNAGEDATFQSFIHITGSAGTVHVENMVFPSAGHSIEIDRQGLSFVSTVAGDTTYDHQLSAVIDSLRAGTTLPTEGGDYVNNMKVIDGIYTAAGVR
ncbi:Gfo/Idh/MocA family oxidoreductase [Salinibacterium sp. G-O1]|uniref:Gfo/Idh/MocA family protein n=1 Tax=Salinibacterium sp. G-O1 TaxID=3046208 RepID=UPI0024B8BFEB|nr:Gfo/Idh/MocA family oxidoreductase [Salinibacterium sp. G-O1]MDJ0336313.1 Gfo/Idh/MocA family oxidoreductase [Salinibacterium sp. G-O1]